MSVDTLAADRFAKAFLANDWTDLRSQLADDVAFRALAPPRVSEVHSADGAIDVMSSWFRGETVTEIEIVDTESMTVKERATCRFRTQVQSSGESYRVEQHVFLTPTAEGKIGKIDLVCSGWVPVGTN